MAYVSQEKKAEIAAATHFPTKPLHITALNRLIADFSEYKDAASLARTCRFLYHTTKDPLVKIYPPAAKKFRV